MIEKTAMDEPQLHSQERCNIRLPTRRRNDRDGSDPCGVSLRLSHTQEPARPVSWTNTHSPGQNCSLGLGLMHRSHHRTNRPFAIA